MLSIIKNQLPIKVSEALLVRGINIHDKEDLFEMYSNEKISRYVSRKIHTSLEDTEELIEVMNQRIEYGNDLYLGVCDVNSKKVIGIIRFLKKEEDFSTLTIGYALNENYWRRGIISQSLNKLIQIINLEGKYKRLRATVRPENINSQKCLEKLEFTLAGRFKKKEVINDQQVETERFEYFKVL